MRNDKFSFGQKVEVMRDLCGSFYGGITDNQKLTYLIPKITRESVKNKPDWFGTTEDSAHDTYRELLAAGYDALMSNPVTKNVMERFIDGNYTGEFYDSVTETELDKLLDVYYCKTVSDRVEKYR